MSDVSLMGEANLKAVDAKYVVSVAADTLTALLTVSPPENGGTAPDPAAARAALKRAGVVFGIHEEAIIKALGPALGCQIEVARGTPPQSGTDGWLEPLVAVNRERHIGAEERAQVDFRDRGATPSVSLGDALMRRRAPVPGTAGKGVTGKLFPVAPPRNADFAVRMQGVEVDPADPDLLRAAVAGQPILMHGGITVEPILRFEAIDMATGNVEFIGSVEIRGDVKSGMHVKAGGDITVGGNVEPAELVSGGNIVVKGGVIGHSHQEHKDAEPGDTARLTAKGSIKARYLENCIVLAEQKVEVDEAIIQSDVTAIDQIVVGQGNGKGSIVGGFVRATAKISAGVLGGPEGSQTRVFVGVNPLLQKAIEEHRQRLDAKLKENGELTKVLKLLATRPDKREIADKARLTLKKVNEEIAEILSEERVLKSQLHVAHQARIVVGGRVCGGVMVAIGKKSQFVSEDIGAGVFVIADDELIYGDLAAYGG
jgi:uncharacterized protein (DUF342 family)